MKKQLVKHFADKLVSFGYTVYIAKSGDYGFYTDGKRCICFGGMWNFSLDISGNYKSQHCGTGWSIEKEISDFDKSDAEKWMNTNPPYWATKGESVKLITPEQHLATYGKSSGYTEYKGVTMDERHLYVLRRNSALWQVFHRAGGKALFSSLSKTRCNDWLDAQFSDNESE